MKDLKRNLFLNDLVLIFSLMIVGCGTTGHSMKTYSSDQSWLEKYETCRGKGSLTSKGLVSGKLSFTFTCAGEDVFIHFKDMLGRKTMIMIIKENDVNVWDIFQNVRFSKESIFIRFPFFEVMKPSDLSSLFWGMEPLHLKEINNIDSESSINIRFSSNDNGLQTVYIEMKEDQSIELTFKVREYGSTYPHLIKQIPESTPYVQS